MTLRQSLLSAVLILFSSLSAFPLLAQTPVSHYVAPKGATNTCSGTKGSATCPWPSVATALSSGSVKGGDILLLLDGLHDRIAITGANFSPPVTIRSENERNARVDTIFLRTSSGFTFQRLSVWGTLAYPFPLIRTDPDTSNFVFTDLDLRSVETVSDVLSWSAEDWIQRRRHGIWLDGTNQEVSNSVLQAVQGGIWSSGPHNRIIGNRVVFFSGDALRAGNHTTVKNNYVANAMLVDNDHLDGFQSIGSPTLPVTGLVLDGNVILEWALYESHPLRSGLQAVGMFDGFYDDFTIQNNVIAVSSHHGISVYGGRRGKIVNNTVTQISGNPEKFPWIAVTSLKNDGSPSLDVTVANNVAMAFSGESAANNVVFIDNQVILYPAQTFQNPSLFDYRLKSDSGMIDNADPTYSPDVDINGTTRPTGAGPDKGAYEVGETPSALPVTEPAPAPPMTEPGSTLEEKPLKARVGRWLKARQRL